MREVKLSFSFLDAFNASDFQPADQYLTATHNLPYFHSFAFTLTEAHVCAAELAALLFHRQSMAGTEGEEEEMLQPDLAEKLEQQQRKREKEKPSSGSGGSSSEKKSAKKAKRLQKQAKPSQESPRKAEVMALLSNFQKKCLVYYIFHNSFNR